MRQAHDKTTKGQRSCLRLASSVLLPEDARMRMQIVGYNGSAKRAKLIVLLSERQERGWIG
ncbi:hypothetical protein F1880_003781 [Penicillium rolfsii]|nr:hypothetical protein F1880_003781 [Penicillium rolfsii]